MIDLSNDKRIRIITGHYGVGKSEFSINYAKLLKQKHDNVVIVDLDVVNPYFTSRGVKEQLEKEGIRVIGPSMNNTSNDVPAIPAEVSSIFYNDEMQVLVDLGGAQAGGKVIGQFREKFKKTGFDMFYLVNTNRPFTQDYDGVEEFLDTCQLATKLNVTKIVNSTHLLFDTTLDDVKKGYEVCKELSSKRSIPIAYNVIPEYLKKEQALEKFEGQVFPVQINLRPSWLDVRKNLKNNEGWRI